MLCRRPWFETHFEPRVGCSLTIHPAAIGDLLLFILLLLCYTITHTVYVSRDRVLRFSDNKSSQISRIIITIIIIIIIIAIIFIVIIVIIFIIFIVALLFSAYFDNVKRPYFTRRITSPLLLKSLLMAFRHLDRMSFG